MPYLIKNATGDVEGSWHSPGNTNVHLLIYSNSEEDGGLSGGSVQIYVRGIDPDGGDKDLGIIDSTGTKHTIFTTTGCVTLKIANGMQIKAIFRRAEGRNAADGENVCVEYTS